MTFNGHQIGDRFLQFAPDRGILSEVENTMQTVGTSNGDRFMRGRIKSRVLPVQYDVMAISQREFERMMAPLLYTTEPAKLFFSDRTDEYWLAKVDGKIDLTRAYFLGSGTINFIVPDGVAHSLTTKTADNIATDGTLGDELVVQNDGTYPVYPVIEATMHSDNGVISFINEDNGGVLEFGNSEEVDGATEQKSEQVIHYTFDGGKPDAGLTVNAGTMFYNDSGRSKIAGGFVDPGSGEAVTPTFTGTSSDRWNGPTLHGAVPASDEGSSTGNFLYTNRINFPATIGHTGRIELILGNDNGIQMVFVIREATVTRKQLIIEGWCMGQMLVNKTLDLNAFNSDFMEVQMGRIGANLLFQIAKISELKGDVPVYASKLAFTPTYPDFAAVPISNMTTWFARFGATNASKLTWTDAKFEWTNISFWNDMANQYSAGDVLTVDAANRSVALNGVLTGGLQRLGNDWSKFKLQPGSNKLLMVTSSFAQTPEVRISYKEAWL